MLSYFLQQLYNTCDAIIVGKYAGKVALGAVRGKYDQAKIDSREVYSDLSVIDKWYEVYQMDDRDMFCLVSFCGDEPVLEEIARRAKAKGQKVVVVLNSKSNKGKLLDYADEWLFI